MKEDKFVKWIREAIEYLPVHLKEKLSNIEITVKDMPGKEDPVRDFSSSFVLGFYEGVPLGRKRMFHMITFPDRITLFSRQIEKVSSSEKEMRELTIKTTLHEIGHYFGLSEKELLEIEVKSLKKKEEDE